MTKANLISDAEWEIMRIVWSQHPTTSNAIITALESTTGWMPTTVKTLLSRLVTKQILAYEAVGRTYYYSPLISEEKCIRQEIHALIEKVYGSPNSHTSAHFIIKGTFDTPLATRLSLALEGSYQKITSHLQCTPEEPITLYVHQTQQRLHSALGLVNGPQWLRSGHIWDMIHLAPPHCYGQNAQNDQNPQNTQGPANLTAEQAAVHTLTLLLLQKIDPNIPYWLQQAVATYESAWLTHDQIAAAVHKTQGKTHFKSAQYMHLAFDTFKEAKGYELAYTVMEYIYTHHTPKNQNAPSALAKFLRNGQDYVAAFAISEKAFWSNWQIFIAQRYPQK